MNCRKTAYLRVENLALPEVRHLNHEFGKKKIRRNIIKWLFFVAILLQINCYDYSSVAWVCFPKLKNLMFRTLAISQTRFWKCKQLFEYQHLLSLRDIWWSKF
jgi:hypothetical protein